jgi:hypothetical protein
MSHPPNKPVPANVDRSLRDEADLAWRRDELWLVWQAAQFDAVAAYRSWSAWRGATAYSVYRAAQDRADRAQDELADEHSKSLE